MVTSGGQFVIEDTYWTEDDYVDAVEQVGSTDEAFIPPCIVIEARKVRDALHSENPGGLASSGLCSWNARAAGRVRIQS